MELMHNREKKTLETKRKIVEAAGRIIRQYDFRYLTVKNVCEEAQVAYGSFYHHFGSKEHVIYEYCRGLFEKMLEANPLPDSVNPDDFIRVIVWYLLVYARFCELMGKDIIRYIFQNCPDDMFYRDHFDRLVWDTLQKGYEDGYVDMATHPERLSYIADDVSVVYKGVVYCWLTDMEVKSHRGRLCVGMEHVVHQILGSFRTEKYREMAGKNFLMVTDTEDFESLFTVIPELCPA